ncbi:MAG: adenine deaminase C-terminal domain-containing protein, partial [Chitinophagaceae bacterium]
DQQKPIDGHAPGLRGDDLRKYISRGISTDHECFTLEEAIEKIQLGMKIIIREGSAAKNFEALHSLITTHPEMVMFCSDDKHPDELAEGHINRLVARAISKGHNLYDILIAACVHPVEHYNMNVGLLKVGDDADFIIANNIKDFSILATYIKGTKVAENSQTLIPRIQNENRPNNFHCEKKSVADIKIPKSIHQYPYPIIEALDGQLITNKLNLQPKEYNKEWTSDTENDILKIVVVNRYQQAPVSAAFIHAFGLNRGAIASSVAHDSHNIVAIGVDDESIIRAINLIIEKKGGISLVDQKNEKIISLPVAGLMSDQDGFSVAKAYSEIDDAVKNLGSTLRSPFMTLSFMALLVIPHLKLSDKGLFDGDHFCFVN